MNSNDLAKYIEATDSLSQPWLLIQLRLKKLQDNREYIPDQEYYQQLAELHQDLMQLGEWWVGREAEVFGAIDPKLR